MIPIFGSSGIFKLDDPFMGQLQPGISYTCVAVRLFEELTEMGIDPFEEYYQPNGIDRARYDEDVLNNVAIVSLRSTQNAWITLPDSFIIGVPNPNGVPYHAMLLSVDIGAIPETLALDSLIDTIKQVTKDYLGVVAEVQEVVASDRELISMDDHDTLEAARRANIATDESDRSKAIRMETAMNAMVIKIKELEDYIAANLPPP